MKIERRAVSMKRKTIITGVNFLGVLNPNVYRLLNYYGYLSFLKYPGISCNFEELNKFIGIAKELNVVVDIHGLPGLIPRLHAKHICDNIDWERVSKDLFSLRGSNVFSTHIGADKLFMAKQKDFDAVLRKNMYAMKNTILVKYNRSIINVGGENQPGGRIYPQIFITPEFVGHAWEILDFGVFDVSHARLAAEELGITFEEYVERLKNRDKVKIIHISGCDLSVKNPIKRDSHIVTTIREYQILLSILPKFKHVKRIASEYAYHKRHSNLPTVKDLVTETITLHTALETRDISKTEEMLTYLKKQKMHTAQEVEKVLKRISGHN